MSLNKKINGLELIKNFEARKGEPIASVKSNWQIEQEQKLKNWQRAHPELMDKNVNKNGQYHL